MAKNATATTADQETASSPTRLMPLTKLADYWNCARKTTYDWAAAGKFELYRPANSTKVYVDMDEIEKLDPPRRQVAKFGGRQIHTLPPRVAAVPVVK